MLPFFSNALREPSSWLKKACCIVLLLSLTLATAELGAGSASGEVSFARAPEGAKAIQFPLTVLESPSVRSPGYLAQRSPEPAAELASVPAAIAEAYTGKEFNAFEFAHLADGTRYLVVLNEDKNIRFLARNDSPMWYARLYRVGAGSDTKPEVLREGFQSSGNDVVVPVDLELAGIGVTKVKKVHAEIGYSLSGYQNGKPQVFTGRSSALQVVGSQMVEEGKLTLTVTVPEEMKVTDHTQVALRFEPLTPGLPERSASGKVTDFLTLGSARFAITGMAPDFSEATAAVVAGSLRETLKEQLQVGAQMPPFSQVDLVTRKSVTREDLLGKAKAGAPVIFVFGDLPAPRNPYGPPVAFGAGGALPMPPGEVADQLGLELQPKPLVVLVTRQISIEFLYGDLRNKTPDYLVLSDFADPLRTSFRVPQSGPGGWYPPGYPGARDPSLRQLFNLPERTLSIAAFDSNGKVLYVKADAGSEFLQSIAEARKACQRRR